MFNGKGRQETQGVFTLNNYNNEKMTFVTKCGG